MTSPPPVSLGRKVEVDLKLKQKKFEGLDRQAQQVIARVFFNDFSCQSKHSNRGTPIRVLLLAVWYNSSIAFGLHV